MMRTFGSLVAVFAVSSALAECPADHFSQSVEAARHALGVEFAPRMAYIPQNIIDGDNPSRSIRFLCERVAQSMRESTTQAEIFAIASVDPAAEMSLMRCLAEANRSVEMPLLRLVFVGSSEHEAEARAIVEGWGSQFLFVSDHGFEQEGASNCDGAGKRATSE